MILPTISLNGTSPRMLREGYEAAYRALGDALRAMEKIEFNSRDYAQQENGWENWKAAQAEQRARYAAVTQVQNDMLAICDHCNDFIND